MSELTEGVKLVALVCRSQLVFLSAATETCGGKLKRGVASLGGLESGIQELLKTLENWSAQFGADEMYKVVYNMNWMVEG